MKLKAYMIIIISMCILVIIGVILTPKDTNKYSNIECMEDYTFYTNLLSEYDEGSDGWCEVKFILDNGFYKDKDSVIHERYYFNDLIESINK